jgi:hypothetical protein
VLDPSNEIFNWIALLESSEIVIVKDMIRDIERKDKSRLQNRQKKK